MSMTISQLPFKLIKIWLYRIISTLLYLSSDWNREFLRPKINKTRILPKVGNMTLLPNPGLWGGFTRASNIVPTLTKVWDWAGIKLKTPGLAVRHAITFWLPPQGGAYSRSLTSKYSLSPPIHVGRWEDTNDSCITFINKCIKQVSITQITCDNVTTRTAPMCDCQPSVYGACSLSLIKRRCEENRSVRTMSSVKIKHWTWD